jgi:hypothetical protein
MHGIGGEGEYCGDNDAQLDRINVFLPRSLGWQVRTTRGALRVRHDRRCARVAAWRDFPSGQARELKRGRGQQLGQGPLQKG